MAEKDTWNQEMYSYQNLSEEDTAYMEDTWTEEDDDYGQEPDIGEPEPDPPDQFQDHSSQKRWYEEEEEEDEWRGSDHEHEEESWTEDDSSQGGYDEESGRGELNLKPPASKRSPIYHTPYKLKHEVTLDFNYKSADELRNYVFSGGKSDYLEWEYNMDEDIHYYSIPREERLAYCLKQLRGEAKRWWYQEEDYRWYYKEPPINTWRSLKRIMRERYAPHSQKKPRTNTYHSKETSQGGPYPSLLQNTIPKLVKDQSKFSVPNIPLELTCYKHVNRGYTAKKYPSKKITSSINSRCEKKHIVQEKKPVIVKDQKKAPITVMAEPELESTEVMFSRRLQNIEPKNCT